MSGDAVAKVLGTLPAILWAVLAIYIVFLLRDTIGASISRLANFEAFGVKFSMSGGQAMSAAIEMARKGADPNLVVPEADRQRALDRANRERALVEGAELLWVDDRPSNDRNEARMLRSFGALITFACTTDEALTALRNAAEQQQPFHLILSDISRDIPAPDPEAGIKMLARLHDEKVFLPVIFYIAHPKPGAPAPAGSLGVTNRPDQLLHLVLDGLARTRGKT
jgi:CheY-like chemotaxis protein